MAEYTPGPWAVRAHHPWERPTLIVDHRNIMVAVVATADACIGPEEIDANAAILSAAPDMHAALEAQAARDAHGRWNCTSCLCDDVECSVKVKLDAEALRLREAALAKAKGQ